MSTQATHHFQKSFGGSNIAKYFWREKLIKKIENLEFLKKF